MKKSIHLSKIAAMTFGEVLVSAAVVGVIAAVAVSSLSNTIEDIKETKLSSDTKELNAAVKIYVANGGQLTGDETAEQVIAKLKTYRTATEHDTHVGLSENMIDHRLKPVMMTTDEAAGAGDRVVWKSGPQNFQVAKSGAGIKEFIYSKTGTQITEERRGSSAFAYSPANGWIWEYSETEPTSKPIPTLVPLSNPGGSGGSGSSGTGTSGSGGSDSGDSSDGGSDSGSSGDGGGGDPAGLAAPLYSIPGGSYPLGNFDLAVSLANPNPVGSSQILYRVGYSGPFAPYTGSPIPVSLGATLFAFANSLDSGAYYDSFTHSHEYNGLALQLQMVLSGAQSSYTYFDLVDQEQLVYAQVANWDEIPEAFQNSSAFDIYYTRDGSSPSQSPRYGGADFGSDFAGFPIPLSLSSFEDGVIQISAVAEASSELLLDSEVATTEITAEMLDLGEVVVETTDLGDGRVEVALAPSDAGDRLPPGWKIYYGLDDVIPGGDSATNPPAEGSEYLNPFVVELEVIEPLGDNEDGTSTGDGTPGQTVNVSKNSHNVPITQVVLSVNGQQVIQDKSQKNKKISGYAPVIVESITINDDGNLITAPHFNTLNVDVYNINYPASASSIVSVQDGSNNTSLSSADWESATESVLGSTNLRQFLDYNGTSSALNNSPFDFDLRFGKSLKNYDYLVVAEKHGNSTFELTPLDGNGHVIEGSNVLRIKPSYDWDTGYSSQSSSNQTFEFTVVDIEEFGVDTTETPIQGFRLNNDGHADLKFFTMSDQSFDEREDDPEPTEYAARPVNARVFPPADLEDWFSPSATVTTSLTSEASVPGE